MFTTALQCEKRSVTDIGDYYITHVVRMFEITCNAGVTTTLNLCFNWWPLVC